MFKLTQIIEVSYGIDILIPMIKNSNNKIVSIILKLLRKRVMLKDNSTITTDMKAVSLLITISILLPDLIVAIAATAATVVVTAAFESC